MKKLMRMLVVSLVAVMAITSVGSAAPAGYPEWIGPAGGSWTTAGNWDLGAVPGTGDTATFSNASTEAVISTTQSVGNLNCGVISGVRGTLRIANGGTLNVLGATVISYNAGCSGKITVDTGGTFNNTSSWLTVGQWGFGNLVVKGTATVYGVGFNSSGGGSNSRALIDVQNGTFVFDNVSLSGSNTLGSIMNVSGTGKILARTTVFDVAAANAWANAGYISGNGITGASSIVAQLVTYNGFQYTQITAVALATPDAAKSTLPLVKIKCLGNSKFATVTTSTLYANKTGVGSNGVFYKEDLGSNVFALKSPSTGTYVTVGAGSTYILTVGTATTPGTNEKFTQVASGSYWAMQAMRNSRYVTGNTTGNKLQATKTTIGTYEQYSFTQVVDIYAAMTTWAYNYSDTKYKLADTALWPNYNTFQQMYVHEERKPTSSLFWIYEEFRNRDLSGAVSVWNSYGVRMIGDWEHVVCYKTVPISASGLKWTEGIPRCYRYLEPAYVGNTSSQTVNWRNILTGCTETSAGSGSEYGKQKAAQVLNLSDPNSQENMGSRWTVDVGYKDDFEYWTVDIGPYDANQPTTVIISPKYGIVRYYRFEPGRSDIDSYAEFTNIQDKFSLFGNRCP